MLELEVHVIILLLGGGAQPPPVGQAFHIHEVSTSHTTTNRSR